ncbi:hypothetical protein [Amycolatopsis jiangsuensis]|uniref:Uncharacterized protein n=1 Tax=Amycolatopsis jiangsuensis TaxID=1181879 RepID=A0A840J7T6_9PSEU|nr:hypothetical protein [Amycolatopsis jiangsuensis]MBB4689833.1 hypothetical protein [Amycolatopsis jiangsuensis]
MPNTTPIYGFRYPTLTEPPNGPDQVRNLAFDLETKIATMDAIINAQITTRYAGSVSPTNDDVIGTSEAILTEKVTFAAVAGHRYLVVHTSDTAIASGSPSAGTWNYRYASDGSLSTAGTLIQQYVGPPPTGGHSTDTRTTVFTAPGSGTYTIGCGYYTNGGATVRHYANARRLTIVDIT